MPIQRRYLISPLTLFSKEAQFRSDVVPQVGLDVFFWVAIYPRMIQVFKELHVLLSRRLSGRLAG
jgi:hypothetical protein